MEWRDIEEFGGMYQVSDTGQVRSAKSGVILKQHYAGSTVKYPIVVLSNGSSKTRGNKPKYARRYVHRLVASAFVPNPDNKPEVNHIDSDPFNNCADNLEWVTHSENMRHANDFGNAAKYKKKVIREDGAIYESVTQAAKAMNYEAGNMSQACRRGWKVRGYRFAFLEAF